MSNTAVASESDGAAVAGDLLLSVFPEADCCAVHGRALEPLWTSITGGDPELDAWLAAAGEALSASPHSTRLASGRLMHTVASGDADGGRYRFSLILPAGFDEAQAARAARVFPACTELVAESMILKRQLARERAEAVEARRELDVVYRVEQRIHGRLGSHGGLAELVGASGRFLSVAYSVLLLPSKRIRISATHTSWKGVDRKILDNYLLTTLLPRMQGRQEPAVFEIPPTSGSGQPDERGYQAMICPVADRQGNVEGLLALLGRLGEARPFRSSHRRFMEHIVRKAEYVIEQSFDPMTGLMNRAGFEAQLEESARALEDEDDVHQIIYFDLDNLRLVNDSFGHPAGDQVISRFAGILDERLPRNAVAGRLSGDDFGVLLTRATADDAMDLAAVVREACQGLRYLKGDRSLQVTVSAGIAPFGCGETGGEAVTAARIACDAAKDHGRDRVEVYDRRDQSIVRRHDSMQLVADIQKVLDADAFELLAQPIAPLAAKGGAGKRFEILLRMRDARGDEVPTKTLFGAAERYQMMPQIDRWVVANTLSRLASRAETIAETGAVFAINLSGQSLGDEALLALIRSEIAAGRLLPRTICFEVTESAAVSNRSKAQAFIGALRQLGCRLSLDDFGAGLSSFAYLKSFDVDTLKIDGDFIRDITTNRISESMVAAITQVAKVMRLETVAEYVETQAIRDFVTGMGVDYAQGHAVGKPLPLAAVLEELGASRAP